MAMNGLKSVIKVQTKAPAKVNWHLSVGGRLPNGYHPIFSIFQRTSLCDELSIELGPGPFSCEVLGLEGLCEKGTSTLDKAAALWYQATGIEVSVKVKVLKRIPSQSGLGGGSSDAASLLMVLNDAFEGNIRALAKSRLMQLGMKVGCDVPFFLSGCDAAIVSGLGEQIQEIQARDDFCGFIVVPHFQKTSTREAYAALDYRKRIPAFPSAVDLEWIYNGPINSWNFVNHFEMVNEKPRIEVLDGEFLTLTGSGSCWVLITERKSIEVPEGYDLIPVSF